MNRVNPLPLESQGVSRLKGGFRGELLTCGASVVSDELLPRGGFERQKG